MHIRVLLFGATAQIVGEGKVDLQSEAPASVGEVLERLSADHPALRSYRLLSAVNQEYVGKKHILEAGDELAIFTAVSGG